MAFRDEFAGFVNFAAVAGITAFGAYELAHYQDQNLDFSPSHEVSAQHHVENQGITSNVYAHDGDLYLLRQTPEGV